MRLCNCQLEKQHIKKMFTIFSLKEILKLKYSISNLSLKIFCSKSQKRLTHLQIRRISIVAIQVLCLSITCPQLFRHASIFFPLLLQQHLILIHLLHLELLLTLQTHRRLNTHRLAVTSLHRHHQLLVGVEELSIAGVGSGHLWWLSGAFPLCLVVIPGCFTLIGRKTLGDLVLKQGVMLVVVEYPAFVFAEELA